MAPIVAALIKLGLPILGNAIATKGKDYIEEKIGVDITKMMGSEEGKIELARIEMENEAMLQGFAIKKREQELEETKIEQANTADARAMQKAALAQTDDFSKRFLYYFAWAWSSASVLYIAAITFATIPQANIRFADTILGFILGTVIATILNFFFGSSRSSKDKDVALAEAIKGIK